MQSELKQLIDETAKEAMEVFSDSQYEYGRQGVEHMRLALLHKLRSRAGSDAVPTDVRQFLEAYVAVDPATFNERGLGHQDMARTILDMLAAHATAPESERFCDSHCTWLDHHPDCKLLSADQPERGELPELPPRQISVSVRLQKYGIDRWMTPSADYYTTDQLQEFARQAVAEDRAKRSKKRFDLLSPETLEITRKASEAGEEVAMTPDGPVFINYGDREDRWAEQQAEYDATDWEAETIRLAARVQELEAQLATKPAPVDEEAERERFDNWLRKELGLNPEADTTFVDAAWLPYRAWKARASLATAGGDVCAADDVRYGDMTLGQIRNSPRDAGVEEVEAMADALLFKPVVSSCWPRDSRHKDEIIVDLVAANKRIYELEQQLAGGDEKPCRRCAAYAVRVKSLEGQRNHYREQFEKQEASRTEAVNTLESERAANAKLTAELADSSRLAEAVRKANAVHVYHRRGYGMLIETERWIEIEQALAQYEGKEKV